LRLVAGGWFVLREKYCWLVADKPSEQAADVDNPNPIVCGCRLGYDVSDIQHMDYLIIECG
jgi:hypothetical protein